MKRTPRLPRPRQPSTYSTFSTQSMPTTAWRDINPHSLDLPRAQRTTSMNSVTGDSASAMTSSTSSSNSSSKSSHTVTPKGPRIEQKPPSSKLVIFAKSANGGSIQGNVQGVEIMVMERKSDSHVIRNSESTALILNLFQSIATQSYPATAAVLAVSPILKTLTLHYAAAVSG